MFARLGQIVVHHPWRVIALWVLAAIGVIATSPGLSTTTDESSFLPQHYESIQASNLQDSAFPQSQLAAAVMVFSRSDGGKLTATDSARATAITNRLASKHIERITAITPARASANRQVQTSIVGMSKKINYNDKLVTGAIKTLRDDAKPLLSGTGLTMGVTGSIAQQYDSLQSSKNADSIVLLSTFGLILILLLVIFRSPIIAILPLIVIGIVSQVATGFIADANAAFNLHTDSSISQILIVVLFGIGTDYILFLMFRYRERLRAGEDPKQAMIGAVTRVGEAIASAAGAVIVAFMALIFSTLSVLRSMGPALAIAVAVTLVAGLTLVPAVVSLLGTKVFWPSKSWRREPEAARFAALGRGVGRRPAVFAGASGLVMIALTVGAFGYHPSFDLASGGIPKTAESAVALRTLEKGLPAGATDPTDVFLHNIGGQSLSAAELSSYRAELARLPSVGAVAAPRLSADSATADFSITLTTDPASTAAINAVKGPIRSGAHSAAPAGTEALVGGTTSVYADIQRAVNHDYSLVFPLAAVVILLILGLLLRSVVAPWYLMASVGLGFAATLGATTLAFQTIGGQNGIIFLLPVYMYLFVVALGTDYNILMVARLREEAKAGHDPRAAVVLAVQQSGPTIAAAGVILAGTFASLILAGNTILSELGFAVSFGIAISAFVMAMFFTPSLTALIGRRAWWPGHDSAAPTGRPEHELVSADTQRG